jgi:hypothetical protein
MIFNILAATSHSSELKECLKSVLKDNESSNGGIILFFGDRKVEDIYLFDVFKRKIFNLNAIFLV